MPPPTHTRFNAKARQSSAGGSSHKQKKNPSSSPSTTATATTTPLDSNSILLPASTTDRHGPTPPSSSSDPAGPPLSSKKRKRLDAYIASRLKKEERVRLLAQLARSSNEVDRADLKSSATLGTGRAKTGLERIETAGKKEASSGKRGRKRRRDVHRAEEDDMDADLDPDGEEDGGPVGEVEEDAERRQRILRAASVFQRAPATDEVVVAASDGDGASSAAMSTGASQVGAALARGIDGKPLVPQVKTRVRRKNKQLRRLPGSGTSWGRSVGGAANHEQDSDSSFDSSASSEGGEDDEQDGGETKRTVPQESEATRDKSHGPAKQMDVDSDQGSDEDEDDDGGGETDSDEDAVLLEAMRLRGLLPNGQEAPAANGPKAAPPSPPYSGFPAEGEDEDSSEDDDEDDDHDSGSEEDGSDDSDDQDSSGTDHEDENQPRSRRRGIGQSARSRGFKDWARSALGMGGAGTSNSGKGGEAGGDDETAFNLEPVGGYKVRVGDLGPNDGVARGPLGRDEVRPENKSAFAAKFYAELQETIEAEKAEQQQSQRQPSSVASSSTSGAKRIRNVDVTRDEDLVASRLRLPVVAEEENIVRTIMENPVTVICGETGSGKTTQVPQFLYEAAFGSKNSFNPGMIGITQPRRVAAVSMAQRVAKELNLPETKVSHQIRYDATVSPHTAIKFMTDGVLLRELATDFLLTRYSAILVDEAHERSVNTDVLIGVLSRVVRLREQRWLQGDTDARPLRLIIMSATLRVSDFTHNTTLFTVPPPVINIDARQHPVTVHFNRRTVQDYLAEAVKKTTKIHARLPPGGILIFLTGQQEISTVCKRLEKRFGRRAIEQRKRERQRAEQHRRSRLGGGDEGQDAEVDDDGPEDEKRTDEPRVRLAAKDGDVEPEELDLGISKDLALDVDDGAMDDDADDPEALDTDSEDGDEEARTYDADLPAELRDDSDVPMHILPLYSLLPSDKQMRIFAEPPPDSRLVVVATNVAETSLTIPNIKYVVDCGRGKERKYDLQSGVQSFEVSWISKASAAQRAGRAGRTGPGHCYRLYSSAVYEDHFAQFSSPEILRTPVDGLVLSMKAMNIDNVANFPFPTPPDRSTIRKAEKTLTYLGALESGEGVAAETGRKVSHARITELGRSMTLFPVSPRFGKLLAQGQQGGCLPYMIALVAALSIGDPFLREQVLEDDEADVGEPTGATADLAHGEKEGDADLAPELANLTNQAQLEKERRKAKRARYFATMRRFELLGAGLSDTFRLLSVIGAYEYARGGVQFCTRNFLRPKAMEEMHKLRAQLCNLVGANVPRLAASLATGRLDPPSETQLKMIRQLLVAAYIDQVAVRADLVSSTSGLVASSLARSSTDAATSQALWRMRTSGGGDQMASTRGVPYKAMGLPGFGYIHPSSTFYHAAPPDWIVFAEIQQSQSKVARVAGSEAKPGTVWLKTVTRVNPAWLSTLGRALCSFSKPVELGSASGAGTGAEALAASVRALKNGGGGKGGEGVKREVVLTPTYAVGAESEGMAGGLGWELPPIRATQTLVKGRWVTQL